ncbi:hypothetical protein [Glutamicibacter nicotianae]|uniref:hypothetical protein n=1 Tax=Glutamicibacter nicotianae TaxID=37929 RepID=UPI0031E2109E
MAAARWPLGTGSPARQWNLPQLRLMNGEVEKSMNFDATLITAVVTLIVLAVATAVLVIRYKRTHQAEIRQALIAKARKRGVASPEDCRTTTWHCRSAQRSASASRTARI